METIYKRIAVSLLRAGYPEPENIVPLKGDASNRSYFRVFLPSVSSPTMIIMVLNEDTAAKSEEIGEDEVKIDEHPFVNIQKLFFKLGIRVPDIKFFYKEMGIMGLEDFGDCILEKFVKKGKNYKDIYKKAVDFLVVLHSAQVVDREKYIPFHRRFGYKTFFWEFEHYLEYGLEKNGFDITAGQKEKLLALFQTLSTRYETYPYAITHRDYHSRNILIKDDEIAVIDFQDALMAPWQYDLVSLLRDAYVKLPDGFVEELIEQYISGMEKRLNIEINREKFMEDFDLLALHRNLKAIGRFYYIKEKKGKDHLIKYVPILYDYVFEYIKKYPFLSPIEDVLRRNKNRLKNY